MKHFIGIDLGGTVVKASVFDAKGRELHTEGLRTPLVATAPGQAERSIAETRVQTYRAVKSALEGSGIDPRAVAAVCTTGHGKGLYSLRSDGSPGLGIVSTDTRSLAVSRRLMESADFDSALYSRTLQPLWPAHTATILAWLKQDRPEDYRGIATILWAKDLLRYFLTGVPATDKTDISGTGLWNNRSASLDDDLLARLGISDIRRALPDILESHETAGLVNAEAAAATGLPEGTPVLAGLFDVNACCLATGIADASQPMAVVGTWSISAAVTDDIEPLLQSGGRLAIGAHCVPGQWMVHEASPTSASNLEWFAATMLPDIPEADRFDYCNRVVEETAETGVTFFPYLFGDDMGANATGTFWGLRAGTDRAAMIRGVYEGIVFQHMRHMNRLRAVLPAGDQVRFAGGATRSAVWMQIFADTLGLPVVVASAQELGALGAAICAAVGVGEYPDYPSAMAAMTHLAARYEPHPERGAVLRRKAAAFAEAVADMEPVWRRHGAG